MRKPTRAAVRDEVTFKGIVGILLVAVAVITEYAEEALQGTSQPSADPFPMSIHGWDAWIFMLINRRLANPCLTWFFGAFTWLGSSLSVFTIGVVLYLCRRKREGSLALVSLLAGTLVALPLKLAIPRPRPFLTIPDVVLFRADAGSSFPSGHAVRAFAFAFVMSRLRPKLRIPLYLSAGLIAFSRIYLGQHYPLDVFAGTLIGVLAGCLTIKHQGRILKAEGNSWAGNPSQQVGLPNPPCTCGLFARKGRRVAATDPLTLETAYVLLDLRHFSPMG